MYHVGGAYNDYPHSYHVLKKLTNPEHEHFNDLIFLFAMPNNLERPQNIYIYVVKIAKVTKKGRGR